MTCCVPSGEMAELAIAQGVEGDDRALLSLSRPLGDGTRQLEFAVPDAHCAACIRTIETAVATLPLVKSARVNLSRRRVRVTFDPALGALSGVAAAIRGSGYHTYVLDPSADEGRDPVLHELVKSL